MESKRRIRVSKYLSKHLRHSPEFLGLTLEEGGWGNVDDLLTAARKNGFAISHQELIEVVETNDKQRFAFDETGQRIRANQGHSVEVELHLKPQKPPAILYHGTNEKVLEIILHDGLQKMNRHAVHLTADLTTAKKTGSRKGKPVILKIDTTAMTDAGHLFYCSENEVWLTDHVPPEFLENL